MSDLQCPDCGHLDMVPEVWQGRERVVERVSLWFGMARARRVGKVYRCAHCLTEFCVGPQGVYRPRSPAPSRAAGKPLGGPERPDEERSLRDPDQPWDR